MTGGTGTGDSMTVDTQRVNRAINARATLIHELMRNGNQTVLTDDGRTISLTAGERGFTLTVQHSPQGFCDLENGCVSRTQVDTYLIAADGKIRESNRNLHEEEYVGGGLPMNHETDERMPLSYDACNDAIRELAKLKNVASDLHESALPQIGLYGPV